MRGPDLNQRTPPPIIRWMAADPYAAHDPGLTRRFAGLIQILTGGAVLFAVALSDSTAQTVVTVVLAVGALATGVLLLRGWAAGYSTLLGLNYMTLAGVIGLSLLAGPASDRLDELYLGVLLGAAALHPPRRVAPLLALLAAGFVLSKADSGLTAATLVDSGLHMVVWSFVAAMSSVTVRELRQQRLLAQHDGEVAHRAAMTDALTGLGNRRKLLLDLDEVLSGECPAVLALFDLDGFKAYNDTFGHQAGDALLRRLGERLAEVAADGAKTYRMGGDEFCVLGFAPEEREQLVALAADALTERGDAFSVTASYGEIVLPEEARTSAEALRVADRRMYARKSSGRTSAARQTTDVLLRVLSERECALGEHVQGVAALAERVARRVDLPAEELPVIVQAATLHDIGKAAIPDGILSKRGPLDAEEWTFMKRHTIIGERILAAAPALAQAASIVRASHERFDGAGYPDGLAGAAIPLAARIIFACDAFDAMCSDRSYRPAMDVDAALAELRRGAGSQFDPRVVDALCAVVSDDRRASRPLVA